MTYRTVKLDRIAVHLSGLCLVHCLALPLLIACVPALGLAEQWHDRFHQMMLFFVVPLAIIALSRGYLRHRQRRVIVLGSLGVALLAYAAIVVHGQAHAGPVGARQAGESLERWMTVAGALILAYAHWRNARAVSHCCAEHASHGPDLHADDTVRPSRQTARKARQ